MPRKSPLAAAGGAPRFVAYYRVSTEKQGTSGLGLEAQREAVARHVTAAGGVIAAEFQEIESGKRNDRPEIAGALAACRTQRATLIIAKLDRLARNVHFVSGLIESGVDFVAADMPQANKVMIHMHAVMSEWERDQISERTKAALAAKKARGEWVGSKVLTEQVNVARVEQARSFATTLHTTLRAYCSDGMTVSQMCAELNARGIKSARDGVWQPTQLRRTLERLGLRTARMHKAPAGQAGETRAEWMG